MNHGAFKNARFFLTGGRVSLMGTCVTFSGMEMRFNEDTNVPANVGYYWSVLVYTY